MSGLANVIELETHLARIRAYETRRDPGRRAGLRPKDLAAIEDVKAEARADARPARWPWLRLVPFLGRRRGRI